MKQYIGTKQVKAEPMTRTEAEKLLGREIKPAKAEYGDDGYLVEYEDGYKSWLPKEVFDKAYKPFEDFKDRLRIEHDELFDRLTKLNAALDKDGFREKVGDYQYKLMNEQALGMEKYLKALEDRMKDMGIDSYTPYMSFGKAIEVLKQGKAVRRTGWNGKGMFVVKQVPSHITADIIPKMQSLPQSAKNIIMSRENPHIDYTNQMLIINPNGRADSWIPSSSDVFAEDWEVIDESPYKNGCTC